MSDAQTYKLYQLQPIGSGEETLEHYLKKIKVFISHSKHDRDGETIGISIRDWIHSHSQLDSFFDIYDIPSGLSFDGILKHEIGAGVFLAILTDSYSSREWCRREVIEAKRRRVPMIVVNSDNVRNSPRGRRFTLA
ncbi:MAG: toll/interleukin-1 receptor domain-containing protein, partial [Gammaproteobacteria bacterium]|nr:toll/interleukin-1 receptor domain-containing protein [Gammaproteobacteria bacterium]